MSSGSSKLLQREGCGFHSQQLPRSAEVTGRTKSSTGNLEAPADDQVLYQPCWIHSVVFSASKESEEQQPLPALIITGIKLTVFDECKDWQTVDKSNKEDERVSRGEN